MNNETSRTETTPVWERLDSLLLKPLMALVSQMINSHGFMGAVMAANDFDAVPTAATVWETMDSSAYLEPQ